MTALLNPPSIAQQSIPAPTERHDAGIKKADRWTPVPLSKLSGDGEWKWVWTGFIARELATLFVGMFKAGKTTLLSHLFKKMETGGDLAGMVDAGKVLVVSEESPKMWIGRRDSIGIGDHVEVICRPFKGRPSWVEWERFVERVAALTAENSYSLVVIDTIATFLPVYSENESAEMLKALTPLHSITEAGAALLLVHHPRKSDGKDGVASRGSGGLPGWVDSFIEFRRYEQGNQKDCRRVLSNYSRIEGPPEVIIELTENGFIFAGDAKEVSQSDRIDAMLRLGPITAPGLTVDEILLKWDVAICAKPGLRTLMADLTAAVGNSKLHRTGAGVKGDPFRYTTNAIPPS